MRWTQIDLGINHDFPPLEALTTSAARRRFGVNHVALGAGSALTMVGRRSAASGAVKVEK